MKTKYFFIILLLFLAILFASSNIFKDESLRNNSEEQKNSVLIQGESELSGGQIKEDSDLNKEDIVKSPLPDPDKRISKKKFATFVTPENSPVSPEKFYGYHTGVDFEILPGEENTEVTVSVICSGNLLEKRYVSGYGGVAVQSCKIEGNPVTVIYGHLKLDSVNKKIGENIEIGQSVGILGKGYSGETDGERKHLHLGIHRGSSVNILGYVQNKELLSNWIDLCVYVCKK